MITSWKRPSIQRAADCLWTSIERMGINHGGFDTLVPKQFLHGADIVAVLQEVGGETMPEGVGGDGFVYPGGLGGLLDGFLQAGFMDVVTTHHACFGILMG